MERGYSEILKYFIFYSFVWWLLSEGAPGSWIIGLVVVPLAAWLSATWLGSVPTSRISHHITPLKLAAFIPFFFLQSLRGGWGTARLALQPGPPVKPGFTLYSISLPEGLPRLFFLHVVSLLPGTVSVQLDGSKMLVHALDASAAVEAELRECERRVAALFNFCELRADNGLGG